MAKTNPVSHNPAMVEFPSDVWGFTAALREAGLQTASRIIGNDEKHKLFMDTLRVLAAHAHARLDSDAQGQRDEAARIAERDAASTRRQASHGPSSVTSPEKAIEEPEA